MSKYLFDIAGGKVHTSATVSLTADGNVTLVAAPGAKKRIVPVWLAVWGHQTVADGDVMTQLSVSGSLTPGSPTYDEYFFFTNGAGAAGWAFSVANSLGKPFFQNFGLGHMTTVGVNQKVQMSANFLLASKILMYAKMGYYIVDV